VQKLQAILRRPLVQSRAAPERTAKWENGRFHTLQLSEIPNADFPKMRLIPLINRRFG
jgi:hypothetical protein